MAKRPAAAPGPYDASQFMKFCIKFDKFYATLSDAIGSAATDGLAACGQ